MNVDFKANETMKIVGNTKPICANTEQGKAITELLQGCGLPLESDYIILCSLAMQLGMVFGANGGNKK